MVCPRVLNLGLPGIYPPCRLTAGVATPCPQNGINYEFRPLETRFAPILGGMNEAGADDEARRVPGYHRPAAGTGRTRGPLVWLGFGKVGTDCHAEWAAAIWRF